MTTETKIIGGIALTTILIIGAGVFLSTKPGALPKSEVLSEKSIHWHPKLTIKINGKAQEIPKDIGIGTVHQEIHTHDKDGTIHMEMSGPVTKEEAKLGNFFKTWGKKFSSNCIFDYCNGKGEKVIMLVNGKEHMDYENYIMNDSDKIEIKYE
ncbi:MAG: hypothetical protein Q7R53_00270 [bacterium]|nr:hypothetical protein [bacterium]